MRREVSSSRGPSEAERTPVIDVAVLGVGLVERNPLSELLAVSRPPSPRKLIRLLGPPPSDCSEFWLRLLTAR